MGRQHRTVAKDRDAKCAVLGCSGKPLPSTDEQGRLRYGEPEYVPVGDGLFLCRAWHYTTWQESPLKVSAWLKTLPGRCNYPECTEVAQAIVYGDDTKLCTVHRREWVIARNATVPAAWVAGKKAGR